MIKDLDRILYVLRGIITLQPQINRMERVFELKHIETPYTHISNVVGSFCSEDSPYDICVCEVQPSSDLGFAIFDKNQNLISMFQCNNPFWKTCMYPEWAMLDPTTSSIKVYDSKNDEVVIDLDESMSEEEHFQLMMMRAMPEYNAMINTVQYIKDTMPSLRTHEFCHPVLYEHLDLDFSTIKFKDSVIEYIQENTKFDFISTMINNPDTNFRHQYNESLSNGRDTSWWK